MNMVAPYFPRQYLDIMLHRNFLNQVAHTKCYCPNQYFLKIFRNPYKVNRKIVFRLPPFMIPSHATILHEFSFRLKAREVIHHPRWIKLSTQFCPLTKKTIEDGNGITFNAHPPIRIVYLILPKSLACAFRISTILAAWGLMAPSLSQRLNPTFLAYAISSGDHLIILV